MFLIFLEVIKFNLLIKEWKIDNVKIMYLMFVGVIVFN